MIPLYPRNAEGVMSLQNGDDLWSVMLAHHRHFFLMESGTGYCHRLFIQIGLNSIGCLVTLFFGNLTLLSWCDECNLTFDCVV